MTNPERELIEEKFKGVYLHQQSNFDLINERLEQILQQTTKTNGRVTKLESQTKIVRLFESKPLIFMFVLIALFVLASCLNLNDFIKMF